MKSLSIKIPLSIAQTMDERAELNPMWLSDFVNDKLYNVVPDKPIQELTYVYTFKINTTTHRQVKLKAIEHNLPMNEFVGRLLAEYYGSY
jgi:hypothetical protein